MDGRYCCVPIGFVSDKVLPKVVCGELGRYDDRSARIKWGEKTSEKTVNMEEGHDK